MRCRLAFRRRRTTEPTKEERLLATEVSHYIMSHGGPKNEQTFPRFTSLKFDDRYSMTFNARSDDGYTVRLRYRGGDKRLIATLCFGRDGSPRDPIWPSS